MFAKATRNFLKEVDAGGNLISVSNLNDSDKLQLLSLVTKKKRYWCWQRPKYQFLSVTLGDVLVEDQSVSPVVVESDFVKYEGKFANHVSGAIETVLGKVKLNIGSKGLVESQSSFGTLRKQEVDLQQLIRDSIERAPSQQPPVERHIVKPELKEKKVELLIQPEGALAHLAKDQLGFLSCVTLANVFNLSESVVLILETSKPRWRINLKGPLLQQVLERRNEVLCVLTQKIVTTQKCVISEHVQIEEKCGGMVGIQTKIVQVSAMEDGNVAQDSSVVLEIPAATTIAYGIIELYVKQDGQFEFCLLQEKHGGFEHESRVNSVFPNPLAYRDFAFMDVPDGGEHKTSSKDGLLHILKQVTLLERNFYPFMELSEQQQVALHHLLQVVLFDEEFLVALEQVCDDMLGGLWSPQATLVMDELKPPQLQDLTAFLQLVGCTVQGEHPGPQDEVSNQKLFATAYFLVSALSEMPDNATALLGTCCKLQIIPTLCYLLHTLSDNGVSDLEDPVLAPLKDTEKFGIVQCLFASCDISLERLQSSVKAVILSDSHIFPLILSITLSGLHALGRDHQ